MRKIAIESWKAIDIDGKDMEECVLDILAALVNNKDPKEMPKGLDNFRLMNRLMTSFDKAKVSKELILEESDYTFLKNAIDTDIPSAWGVNPSVLKAVEDFLNAKQE
jgi:hypothetical protein